MENGISSIVQKNQKRDLAWVLQIRKGNETAFSRLYETYYEALCLFANRYISQKEIVHDIVQEVFTRLWEHRMRWSPSVSVKPYLYRSVYHQIISDYRKKRFETRLTESHEALLCCDSDSTTDERLRREMERAFLEAMDLLPCRRRQIIEMRLMQGLSYIEISNQLGISRNTVDTQIRRAKKHMRKNLRKFIVLNISHPDIEAFSQ